MAIRGMRTSKILLEGKRRSVTWLEIWRAVICSTLLGLTWTFGVFAIGDVRDVFQWLFCLFNSLQGFFIFLLFVVNNEEIQKVVRKKFFGSDESSSTSSKTPKANDYKSINDQNALTKDL
jgi:7 transmembrane receptor (Secretin family).